MSRIRNQYLDCVQYIFPSMDDAMKGTRSGGTCFLYGIPIDEVETSYKVFVVTCKHLLKGKSNCLRINSMDGGTEIKEIKRQDWFIDSTEDLAIYPLVYEQEMKINVVRKDYDTVTPDFAKRMDIGRGDEVFVVGRFIDHGGEQQNTPVVRFGNLAMMPLEPVNNEEIGLGVLCSLVDLRIRKGFSGSPVFVQYRNRFSKEGGQTSGPWSGERLLGMSWGAFESGVSLKDKETGKESLDMAREFMK